MLHFHTPLTRVDSASVTVGWAVSLLCTFACRAGSSDATNWNGTIRDSAGIQIIENLDEPIWQEGDEWTFTKVLRIGVAEGDSAYMIGGLSGLVILSDGRVVIGDALYHNVRFYSPEGVYLYTLGREGAGPGEFGGYINLLRGPGDTILAVDTRNSRANVISPNGDWLSSYPTLPRDGFWTYNWDDDETTNHIVSLLRPLTGDLAPDDTRYALLMLRDFEGAYIDTLARIPSMHRVTGEGEAQRIHFYRGGPDYDLCDGWVVTGNSSDYRLTWQTHDGEVTKIVTLDREPLEFTDEDQETLLRRIDVMADIENAPPDRVARVAAYKSRIRFESTYPAFCRFVCGPAGTILVQRIKPLRDLNETEFNNLGTGDRAPGSDQWDVFDQEGRYLGVAPLPVPPHRHAFTRDSTGTWLMSGLERGEFNVPYAAVWRIEGIGR